MQRVRQRNEITQFQTIHGPEPKVLLLIVKPWGKFPIFFCAPNDARRDACNLLARVVINFASLCRSWKERPREKQRSKNRLHFLTLIKEITNNAMGSFNQLLF